MASLSYYQKLHVENQKGVRCWAFLFRKLITRIWAIGQASDLQKVKSFSIYDKKLETLALVMAFFFPFRKYRYNLHSVKILIPHIPSHS